jgi:TolA-binding protein
MIEDQKLSAYVGRDLTERERAEQWENIELRLSRQRPRWPRRLAPLLMFAGALAALAVALVMRKHAAPSVWDGARLDSGADQVSVALGDGSRIDLRPASRVAVVEGSAHSVRLDLRKGSARFDVTHVEGRTFSVKSGNVSIRVVGTRFSVATSEIEGGSKVTVAVERGAVEAESAPGAEPIRIRAGQTWSTVQTTEIAPAKPEMAPAPSATAPASSNVAGKSADEAPAAAERAPASSAPHAAKSEPTPQELFESANTARQAGDARAAAASFEALLRHYPSDARAGLAAFELGRLRMDQLGDVPGAVVALRRAAATAPSSGFREDALARLVQAYGTLGNVDACERTRTAYLASYPAGVHASAVRKACGNGP